MNKLTSILITILIFTLAAFPVSAQTPEPPPGPVYIVQEGDTLWDIAIRFNVSVNDLLDGQDAA